MHYNNTPTPPLASANPTGTSSPSKLYCDTDLTLEGPHIHVYPATPSSPSDAVRNDVLGENLNSFSPITPRRRQVLTMGPRADCEKCRMRVPGHWMHFD